MNYQKLFKRQTAIIAASIIGLTLLLVGTSYALFFRVDTSSTQTVRTGTLEFSADSSLAGVTLDSNYFTEDPIPQADSDTHASYTFKVKNTGTLDSKYKLVLYNDPTIYTTDALKANAVDLQYIKVQLGDGTIYKITDLPVEYFDGYTASNATQHDTKYVLASNLVVAANNAINTHTIKIWLASNTAESQIGKTIAIKVGVEGEVNE